MDGGDKHDNQEITNYEVRMRERLKVDENEGEIKGWWD